MYKSLPASLQEFFNRKAEEYNQPGFIAADPISVPHEYQLKQDIEIAGFFSALFAWGNRTTIISKAKELMRLMDNAPYDFIVHHRETDLKRFLSFRHRTFNSTDLLYFIHFLNTHYSGELYRNQIAVGNPSFTVDPEPTLETAFTIGLDPADPTVENGLINFYRYFFSLEDAPIRTRKHISSPEKNSSCKRLNMFLRWMVRDDDKGVDFGIWKTIAPAQLVCPLDVHVGRVARRFGLLTRNPADWKAALELTEHLKRLDPGDPVKYDFALFGLGVIEKF